MGLGKEVDGGVYGVQTVKLVVVVVVGGRQEYIYNIVKEDKHLKSYTLLLLLEKCKV